MARGEADAVASEIIIVRRKKCEEGGHGSTAWKIAFADFMTAMMALFLVLWLTNSTDQATKKQIATYFNPLKLNEETAAPKGVVTEQSQVTTEGPKEQMKPGEGESSGSRHEKVGSFTNGPAPADERLFRDPYDLIRRLTTEGKQDGAGISGSSAAGVDGGPAVRPGEAFRDPFDPVFRSEMLEAGRQQRDDQQQQADTESDAPPVQGSTPAENEKPPRVALAAPNAGLDGETPTKALDGGRTEQVPADANADAKADRQAEQAARMKDEARRLSEAVEAAVAQFDSSAVAKIEVSVEPAGLLISLMDNDNFGMFASASALPNPKLVEMMAKISGVLKNQPGNIVVRGHTDGRQFREGTSDNWRLSMARAYSAYAILVETGVEEARIGRIEGHADKVLRDTRDIGAAANRRIEILIERNPT